MKKIYSILLFFLCFSFLKVSAQKQGQERIDSLQNILKITKEDTNRVNALNALTHLLPYSSKSDTLPTLIKQSLNLAKRIKFLKGEAFAILNMGGYFEDADNTDSSLFYYKYALHIFQTLGFKKEIADTYCSLGRIYEWEYQHDSALNAYTKCFEISKQINYKEGVADYYYGNGVINYYKNDYDKAISFLLISLKIYDEQNDSISISVCNFYLGNSYENKENYIKAREFYFRALQIDEKLKDYRGVSANYVWIGNSYMDNDDDKNALFYYNKALKINEGIGDKQIASTLNHNIGLIYTDQNKYDLALKYLFKGLEIKKEIGYLQGVAISYYAIGDVYFKKSEMNKAIKMYDSSLYYAKKAGSRKYIGEAYFALSLTDSALNNWEQAYERHKLYSGMMDSINNEETAKQNEEIQAKYKNEKKQKQIEILQKDKQLQSTQISKQTTVRNAIAAGAGIFIVSVLISFFFYKHKKDAEQKQKEISINLLASETEMKSLRSQMNPHFIFNALQSIQTFLLSHQAEEANNYLIKFSKLMRAVLENSLHSEVSIENDIEALDLYMQLESIRLSHPFTYTFHIDETVDVANDTIPPLLIQPFVENAIWHGLQYKSGPGHIDIYISKRDNLLHVIVEDNGIGRDKSKKVEYPVILKKESLGMKLTEARLKLFNEIKKSNAEFSITDLLNTNNEAAGTRVELSLPAAV